MKTLLLNGSKCEVCMTSWCLWFTFIFCLSLEICDDGLVIYNRMPHKYYDRGQLHPLSWGSTVFLNKDDHWACARVLLSFPRPSMSSTRQQHLLSLLLPLLLLPLLRLITMVVLTTSLLSPTTTSTTLLIFLRLLLLKQILPILYKSWSLSSSSLRVRQRSSAPHPL